jgi:proline dehydrogenase
MGLLDRLALASLPYVPRPIMRRLAGRYIAGEELEEALRRLAELRRRGHAGILDILGEDVEGEASVRGVAEDYLAAARAVAERQLDAYVSIKPTHLGLRHGEELCFELFDRIAGDCARLGRRLRVEMEDHTTTDATLRVFARLRQRHENVGCVLQSRLLRSPRDVEALPRVPLDVRLVKGIYLEPREVAHVEAEPIRAAYLGLARQLLERGARVGFATHDERLAECLFELVRELGVEPARYEMQVLLGVREPLWERWRSQGHAVRVYVPFGPEWRAYSMRRLRKNPELVRHVVRDLLRGRGR